MKILLVGEYSRLHNSLKEGLMALGHDVQIIGEGDYFKQYPVDMPLYRKRLTGIRSKLNSIWHLFTGHDVTSKAVLDQFFSYGAQIKGFDVVQLINESPLGIMPKHEWQAIKFLKKNNKKLFLLSCGTDYISVKYAYEKNFRYSILDPYFEGKIGKWAFGSVLKYLKPAFKKLHQRVFSIIDGVIATDLDYHIPMDGHPKYMGLIPNPVNISKITYAFPRETHPIVIFHGINTKNYFKKGSDFFEAALRKIETEFQEDVKVITTRDVPYAQYIHAYDQAHILMDQVLGFDQGYNALEAMAKGKVVFTGAEKEWLDYYGLKADSVAINALPNADAIAQKLSHLLARPEQLQTISKNARAFVEREHDYIKIASRYLETWASV